MEILYEIRLRIRDIRREYFTRRVRKQCRRCGKNLRVNYLSNVSSDTILKNNVNFNGMKIEGGGGNYWQIFSFRKKLPDDF